MKFSEGIEHFYNYQRLNVKKNTFWYPLNLWVMNSQFSDNNP